MHIGKGFQRSKKY